MPNAGTNAADDAVIEEMVESASRSIDNLCRRNFYVVSAVARYFHPEDRNIVFVDDISTTTGLAIVTDDDGDATYENTWATTDYNLEPANAPIESGWPYTMITRSVFGNYSFPLAPRGLKITAAWGWAAVPKPIYEACMIMVTADYRHRYGEAGGEVARVTAAGVVLSPGGVPKAAIQKITPYMRLL